MREPDESLGDYTHRQYCIEGMVHPTAGMAVDEVLDNYKAGHIDLQRAETMISIVLQLSVVEIRRDKQRTQPKPREHEKAKPNEKVPSIADLEEMFNVE